MSTRTTPWEPGTPCWVDLSTPDPQAANSFYATLFGWQVTDLGPDLGHYGICTKKGLPVAGIGPVMPGSDAPAAWTTYLASEDVDKTIEAIIGNGGTVLMGPMEVPGQGRQLIAQDPTGAVFGVWQATGMIGSQLVNEIGSVVWNDCNSRDPEACKAFYAAAFGYTYSAMEGDDAYWTIDGAGPGRTIGGIRPLDARMPAQVPSHWMAYFVVENADAGAATAVAGGGTVQVPPFDSPVGRMSVIADPQGAVFTICQDTAGTYPPPD